MGDVLMNSRQQCADKCYDAIMELHGADAFKAMVRRLRMFQQNKEKYSVTGVTLPNYLWIAKRGGGISTRVSALAEYLYNAKIIEFTGIVRYFEFKLAYIHPDDFFSELTRLNNTISDIAGHHRYFRGLACINIDEWVQHTNEEHFHKVLEYIASKNDKVLAIFYVHTDSQRVVESIESSLSSHIRFESLWLSFPDADELTEFIESKYFRQRGFYLADDARALLKDSISAVSTGKNFNGFVTVKQFANDVVYGLLSSDMGGYEISAEMLAEFDKDSAYVKRLKAFVSVNTAIGFGSIMEGY
jgi:hypothetical protein